MSVPSARMTQQQIAFFDDRFSPDQWQIIRADGTDIGVLIVEEDAREIYLAEIQILPELCRYPRSLSLLHQGANDG